MFQRLKTFFSSNKKIEIGLSGFDVVTFEPNDIIILRYPYKLTRELQHILRVEFEKFIVKDNVRVVILESDIGISLLKGAKRKAVFPTS
jgi:hypothetical protein